MGDIKVFAKNEKELETQMQTIRMNNHDIRMEFDIECVMPIIKCGKRQTVKGIQLPIHESIRTLGEKENCNYLGIEHH